MMFLRDKMMEEQSEDGGDGSGAVTSTEPPSMTEEFNAVLDNMEDAVDDESTTATPEVSDATPEVSEVTDATPDAKEVVTTSTEDSFITDELRQRAKNYHLTEEMLQSAGSKEAVESSMLLIDNYQKRQLDLQHQAAFPPPTEPPPANEVPPTEPPPPVEGEQELLPGQPESPYVDFSERIEALKTEGYDDELTNMFTVLNEQNQMLQYQMAGFNQHAQMVQEGARTNHERQVLGLIDSLDRNDLFGSDLEFTDEQSNNSKQVAGEIQQMVQQMGYELNPNTAHQAFQRVFAQQLIKEAGENKTRKVQKQSRKRMGRGSTAVARNDIEWDGPLNEDPVLIAAGKRMLAENDGL